MIQRAIELLILLVVFLYAYWGFVYLFPKIRVKTSNLHPNLDPINLSILQYSYFVVIFITLLALLIKVIVTGLATTGLTDLGFFK